jgi:hypothetical protein
MRHLLLLLVVAFAVGCSGGSSTPDAGASPSDAGSVGCETDSRVLAYVPGVSVVDTAGDRTYALEQGSPSPPARGDNTWQVKVTDSSGQPLANLPLGAAAFMPDHGHGSSVVPQVTPNADGTYSVGPLYFFMPGVWRVTLSDVDGGAAQNGVFFFCIEG